MAKEKCSGCNGKGLRRASIYAPLDACSECKGSGVNDPESDYWNALRELVNRVAEFSGHLADQGSGVPKGATRAFIERMRKDLYVMELNERAVEK